MAFLAGRYRADSWHNHLVHSAPALPPAPMGHKQVHEKVPSAAGFCRQHRATGLSVTSTLEARVLSVQRLQV